MARAAIGDSLSGPIAENEDRRTAPEGGGVIP